MHRVHAGLHEAIYNHRARVLLILAHLILGHRGRAGDGAVEVVGVRGADVGDVLAGLSPRRGVGRVGVNNTANLGEGFVDFEVGGRVRRGAQVALDDLAVEVNHHHIPRLHVVVIHTAGLDYHQTLLAVDGRYITPGEDHEAVLYKVQVCLADLCFEFF